MRCAAHGCGRHRALAPLRQGISHEGGCGAVYGCGRLALCRAEAIYRHRGEVCHNAAFRRGIYPLGVGRFITRNGARRRGARCGGRRPRQALLRSFSLDTVSAAFLVEAGFSPRQAEVVLRYRDASGGIHSEEQFRRCYVVSEAMADRLVPYIVFTAAEPEHAAESVGDAAVGEESSPQPLVEINSADSAQLRSVRGIGEKSVTAIMRYRELLGGFYSVEQLAELDVVTESNYERILTQICCDSCKISKIDINFAGPKELMRHPYVSAKALRRIVKQRQLKGGWSGIGEMIDQNILSEEEAERLAPYLRFVRDTLISTTQTESPQ